MANVFNRVTSYISPSIKSVIVEWELDPRFFTSNNTYTFFVETAFAVDSNWTRLNPTQPVVNQNYYIDTTHNRYGISDTIYYRVVLLDGTDEYTSIPVNPSSSLKRSEYLIVRELLRKEYLRYDKTMAGIAGYLLKRRKWGTVCSRCDGYDEETVANSQCPLCYGTGRLYGYFNALPFWMELLDTETKDEEVTDPIATTDIRNRNGRCVAFPIVETHDIFIGDSDKRYYIRPVKVLAQVRTLPVIYSVELHELPFGRVQYSIPLMQYAGSSSSLNGGNEDLEAQRWEKPTEIF